MPVKQVKKLVPQKHKSLAKGKINARRKRGGAGRPNLQDERPWKGKPTHKPKKPVSKK